MKFLVFTDLHGDRAVLKELLKRAAKEDVDFIVCCGDLTVFSSNLKYILKELDAVGKKFYFIPGNHESDDKLKAALEGLSNCVNMDRQAVEIENYIFLGFGGNGFQQEDAEFRKIAREWYSQYNGRKIVLMTHGPVYGTKVDMLNGKHVGNIDYRKFIERIKPKLALSGHLHETVGVIDKIGDTKVVNPGWEGMVIELK